MARTTGAQAKLALKFETTYGTAPGGSYVQMPFSSHSLGGQQDLIDSNLLGQGRDPAPAFADAETVDGDVTVPFDLVLIGYWLKAALGDPTTTVGTGTPPDQSHVFDSGGSSLPSFSLEAQLSEVPYFELMTGCRVNTLGITMNPTGLVEMTVGVLAQGADTSGSTSAGTLTATALERFTPYQAKIQRAGTDLANLTSAQINYSNGLDAVRTIRSDKKIGGIDLGQASLGGTFEMRLADTNMIDQAVANTGQAYNVIWEISAAKKLTLALADVRLSKPKVGVTGPDGVSVTFDWQANKGSTRMLRATLNNKQANYN